MTIKVHELAKELDMNSKDLVEKIASMGIEVKNHMSVLSDINAVSVKNTVTRSKAGAETKIVKVAPKKSTESNNEPKVVVKAAVIKPVVPRVQPAVTKSPEKPVAPKPPVGRPVMPRDMDSRPKPPIGKPVGFKEVEEHKITETKAIEKTEEKPIVQEAAKPIVPIPQQRVKIISRASDNIAPPPVERRPDSRPPGERRPDNRPQGERRPDNRPQGERRYDNRPPGERRPDSRPPGERRPDNRPPGERRPDNRPPGERRYDNRPPGERRPDNRPPGERRPDNRPPGERRPDNRPPGERRYDNRPPGERRPDNRPPGERRYDNRPPGERRPDNRPPGERRYDNRPPGQRSDNRAPGQRNDNRPSRIDKPDMGIAASKPHIKIEDKKKPEKERDKFAKLEGNKTKKNVYQQRSLEKAPKPKKHIRKEKQVEEPVVNVEELPEGTVIVTVPITVAGFCEQLQISTSTVIMKLMKLGIMANINQNLDEDIVLVLAEEMGVSVVIGKVQEDVVEDGIEVFKDKEEDLKNRPPIITVMGHVDHGKTSLLDAIRKTNVTARESGGITQHIGASEVTINGQKIVFLDTPGHEAFTAMRARGAHATDIAVLVVAADDSVKPQTIESISHAKAAGVPIIVAINKIDKPGANIEKVKQDLSEHGILVEDWGGDTIAVPVSAKSREGIVTLLEMILLQAEVLELKANPARLAMGTVIEARLDKSKGPVATLLVLNGTLHSGMSVVAGTCSGKIRLMTNYKGDTIRKAGPATAVEILGLTDVPEAGDEFNAVKEDKIAREIAENRKTKLREEVLARNSSTTLEQLFTQIQEGEVKELNLIIKGDVQGSVGAIVSSLEKLVNENVRVKILHTGVGTVTESDVMLAGTSGAVIIGFNVRPSTAVSNMADREGVEIRTYSVIYEVIDDVENAMKGMLDPVFKEAVLGKVEIRNTFKVPGVGIIGGAYVIEGKVVRNAQVRLVRDGIVIHEGKISSLKRFKDDAKEVNQNYECGIGLENYNDIKESDIIECFHMVETKRD